MIDMEKFLISLRGNKDPDGRLNPIRLADTLGEEIKIIEEALNYAGRRREWVGLTDEEKLHLEIMGGKSDVMLAEAIEAKLKEKNA